MSKKLLVGGVETFSMVDYPGQMSAVVFLQGCPWRCPFCHNADLQKIGKETGFVWEKFVDFLRERRGKLDAVVFSGGEPLVQDALADAIAEVKELGYKIGIHTGGFRPELFKRILPEVDWVGFDIKTPLKSERYMPLSDRNILTKLWKVLKLWLLREKVMNVAQPAIRGYCQ